jgi:serine/threonine-protein kinase
LLRRVQRGEFIPPRQLAPSIDKALEAACLRAMATKPEDRYASCRALAEDIERWMADEPVTAWSEPRTRTFLRWLTRHRVGVTAAAAAGFVAVIGLASVAAALAQGRAALAIKNRELVAANAKVQARYDLAVDAIKTFHTGVSEDFLLKEDQFKEIRLVAGKPGKAEAECRMALAIFRELADENPDDAIVRDGVASSLVYLGNAVRSVGRPAEARSEYERAIALLEQPVQQNSASAWHRYMFACALRRRGLILRDLGDLVGAGADARRALALYGGPGPRSVEEVLDTACCHAMLGSLAGRAASGVAAAEGEEEAAKSIEWLRPAVAVGFRNRIELRLESALDPLRSRDDFKLLFRDMAMPAEPFASTP